ncbi:uncharacterized protein RHIMIDRAFT_56068 [Rhizopus microsporus ATCC 52813]|uniref:Uncharacterized protein n=1 Tax=Rhizopus microsporus ATCC 52813 TaxID=1340429 RepID=A0A2G4T4T8_RHIZD|nr:uncharacterized protein RHIMIDRAFT_56068 [Rhizopus microsporus ATCC 52813]PHZ16020.1 hypothetical protein RHIMIDRAFT_56068 [Rhizopus microsporus ATCC 52813]
MYLVCQDFLLVAIFCKNALDSQSMVRILGLQAVGRTIAFYVLALPTSGLYVMYEITKVQISDLLQNLSKLIIDISDLLLVLNVYDRVCIPSASPKPFNDIARQSAAPSWTSCLQ